MTFLGRKKSFNFSLISADQFRISGGHVGHRLSEWFPSTGLGIFNFYLKRGKFIMFNLNKTIFFVNKACSFLKQMSRRGSLFLYVDSGRSSSLLVKSAAIFSKIAFVTTLWAGGILTNFRNTVFSSLKKGKKHFFLKKYRLGLSKLDFLPEVIVCSSEFYLPFAISEANTLLIPSVAVVDSNLRVVESTYPIPLNDDSNPATKIAFFAFSSTFWFGRADFALRYLRIMNRFILFNINKIKLILSKDIRKHNVFREFNRWLNFIKRDIADKKLSPVIYRLKQLFLS